MSDSEITIVMTAKDKDMLASMRKARDGMQDIAKAGGSLDQIGKNFTNGMRNAVLSTVSLTSAMGAAKSIASQWLGIQKELVAEAHNLASTHDQLNRRLNILAGSRGPQGEAFRKNAERISLKYAVDPQEGKSIAARFEGANVAPELATGGVLEEFLIGTTAMNANLKAKGAAEAPMGDVAEATVQFMEANNIEKTPENMRAVFTQVNKISKKSFMTPEDLKHLAGEASSLGKLTWQEQLGTYGALREVMPGPDAATALRNRVARGTMVNSEKDLEAFKSVGLDPLSVDAIGESFTQAVERERDALAKVPQRERELYLKTVYDTRGMSEAGRIAGPGVLEKIKEYSTVTAEDEQILMKDMQEATSGKTAGMKRLQYERELSVAASDEGKLDMRAAMERELASRGMDETSISVRSDMAGWLDAGNDLIGKPLSSDTAQSIAMNPAYTNTAWDLLGFTSPMDIRLPTEQEIANAQKPEFITASRQRLQQAQAPAGAEVAPVPNAKVATAWSAVDKATADIQRFEQTDNWSDHRPAEQAVDKAYRAAQASGDKALIDVMEKLVERLDHQTKMMEENSVHLKDNTAATQGNTKAQPAGKPVPPARKTALASTANDARAQ